MRSNTRTCHENSWETTKLGCRHLDKKKNRSAREREKHSALSNRKWLLSHNGYGDVGLVDAVPVPSGRRPELGAAHVCVVGRWLSGLVVLEVFERGYDSKKELCFPWSSPVPIPNAHRSRWTWWVVLRE